MNATIQHPLEPLTAPEVQLAVRLLKENGKVTPSTRFVSVSLKEPPKESVHRFTASAPIRREAAAVLFDNATNSCYEAAVSLTDQRVLSHKHIPGVQPTMTIDEQVECEQAVLASPEFRAALKKHYGLDDTSLVMVDIWSAGNYGSEEDRTRRLARPLCFVRTDPTDNGYARPIEGLRPVVDLNQMQVIRVEEYGHWPLPPQGCNYAADRVQDFRKDIKPLEITQPEGPSFKVDGNAGALAKLELRHRLQRPGGLDAAPPLLRRQGPQTLGAVSRLAVGDGGALRRSGPTQQAARTPSTPANTAWACAPTASSWAATAWG